MRVQDFSDLCVTIVFYCFPGNGEGGGSYFEQAKFIDRERLLPKAFYICIPKGKNITCSGYLFNIIT